jgi:hypothetical protein
VQATLDEFQILLLRRLCDACLRHASTAPDFKELTADQATGLGTSWYHETHEDLAALGLLDPRTAGENDWTSTLRPVVGTRPLFVESLGRRGRP